MSASLFQDGDIKWEDTTTWDCSQLKLIRGPGKVLGPWEEESGKGTGAKKWRGREVRDSKIVRLDPQETRLFHSFTHPNNTPQWLPLAHNYFYSNY